MLVFVILAHTASDLLTGGKFDAIAVLRHEMCIMCNRFPWQPFCCFPPVEHWRRRPQAPSLVA